MANPVYKSGKAEVTIYYEDGDSVVIPPKYIGEDGVSTTLTPGTRTITSLQGTTTVPSGTIDEATFTFPLLLPSMRYLGNVFPGNFTPSVDRPTVAGQTVVGGEDCGSQVSAKVVIHFVCDENSDDDIYIPEALITPDLSTTVNTTDGVMINVMGYAQPSEELNDGVARYGTGDINEPTLFDAETGEYEPVES
jgi:hypothetical protein